MSVSGGWRLLWKGRLSVSLGRWRARIEWGPPIIWRPRFERYAFETGSIAIQAGFGWWVAIAGRRAESVTGEATP